ncbi:MAG: hypothetical protein ACPGUV_06275 [Polyangiales bacterium]
MDSVDVHAERSVPESHTIHLQIASTHCHLRVAGDGTALREWAAQIEARVGALMARSSKAPAPAPALAVVALELMAELQSLRERHAAREQTLLTALRHCDAGIEAALTQLRAPSSRDALDHERRANAAPVDA